MVQTNSLIMIQIWKEIDWADLPNIGEGKDIKKPHAWNAKGFKLEY
jgi:hypothetical protein